MKKRVLWIALIIVMTVGILLYTTKKNPIPAISYTTTENQTTNFKDLQGKVVLIQFWATNCPSCIQEMSDLIKIHKKYINDPVKIVSIAMFYDVPLFVMNYTQSHQLPFDVVIDKDGDLAKAFGEVDLVPTLFVVNKEGRIIKKLVGIPNMKELDQLIVENL